MNILARLHNNNTYELTKEVCEWVSEIREPLVSVEPSENERREYNFKVCEKVFAINGFFVCVSGFSTSKSFLLKIIPTD